MALIFQPSGGMTMDSNSSKIATIVKKGTYAECLAAGVDRDTAVVDENGTHLGYVLSWSIQRGLAGNATITLIVAVQSTTDHASLVALSSTLSIRHPAVEIPITRYGGPSEVNNANLYDIKMWRSEPNKTLYDDYKYRTESGEIITLSAFSKKLADKYKLGYESVRRHYPSVTRTRVYASRPTDIAVVLDYIDTPPAWDSEAMVWLKTMDDCDQASDGSWVRQEAWDGADDIDVNFYGSGTDRWEFGTI